MVDNPAAFAPTNALGVILAGGAARRFGGGDKCLLPVGDTTILGHILDRLRPQVARVALNANGDPARFAAYGLEVIADTEPGQGPVAGLLAGLACARRDGLPLCLTVPGDVPLLPRDLAARLREALATNDAACAVATSGGRRQTVFALWSCDALPAAQRLYESGMRALWRLQEAVGTVEVSYATAPDANFAGINRPEDLAALAGSLAQGTH